MAGKGRVSPDCLPCDPFTPLCRVGPIKAPFRLTYTMGNLSADEARTFFFDHVLPSFPRVAPGASEAWGRIYATCGGNPGLLRNCASRASALDWDNGVHFAETLNRVLINFSRSLRCPCARSRRGYLARPDAGGVARGSVDRGAVPRNAERNCQLAPRSCACGPAR